VGTYHHHLVEVVSKWGYIPFINGIVHLRDLSSAVLFTTKYGPPRRISQKCWKEPGQGGFDGEIINISLGCLRKLWNNSGKFCGFDVDTMGFHEHFMGIHARYSLGFHGRFNGFIS